MYGTGRRRAGYDADVRTLCGGYQTMICAQSGNFYGGCTCTARRMPVKALSGTYGIKNDAG